MRRSRVVLLGASNLTLGFRTAVDTARAVLGGPIDLLAAHGPGRSFGRPSCVLGRGLPGILQCGLWNALGPPDHGRPTYAFVTDVGNDLVYGASPGTIVEWVECCLERLGAVGARTSLALLPSASLERLGRLRYHVFRAVLFPGRDLSYADALAGSRRLQDSLASLAERSGVRTVVPGPGWYGFDPIHVRRSRRRRAWRKMLASWEDGDRPEKQAALRRAHRRAPAGLVLRRPERWKLFGRDLYREQPAAVLADGSTIRLY